MLSLWQRSINSLPHRTIIPSQIIRPLSLFQQLRLKEIKTIEDGKHITISADIKPSEREPFVVRNEHTHVCPVCASGLDIKHTDVLILSQFVRSDGCMLPKRVTGLCKRQQKRVSTMVTMAHKAGLMPSLNPASSKRDPRRRYQWKKFNKYFDESTIDVK